MHERLQEASRSPQPSVCTINRAYMTGNVPNAEFLTVWLSPRRLLTFRFTVRARLRVHTASDLSASQVSSVETSRAQIYGSGLTLSFSGSHVQRRCLRELLLLLRTETQKLCLKSCVCESQKKTASSTVQLQKKKQKRELLWVKTLTSFQITLITFLFFNANEF